MANGPKEGSPEWFRDLLDRLKRAGGDDWAKDLAREMLKGEKKALREALGAQPRRATKRTAAKRAGSKKPKRKR